MRMKRNEHTMFDINITTKVIKEEQKPNVVKIISHDSCIEKRRQNLKQLEELTLLIQNCSLNLSKDGDKGTRIKEEIRRKGEEDHETNVYTTI